MDCLAKTLSMAGIKIPSDLFIPDIVDIEKIPAICKRLNIRWYGSGIVRMGIEPCIVLYRTGKDKGHAEFVSDIGDLLLWQVEIIGLIRLKEDND